MKLLKTINFILFATIMISCADEDKSDQDATPVQDNKNVKSVQDNKDVKPVQDNKDVKSVQDNKNVKPVQDNKDATPVQETKPITGFYQKMEDFLPEEKKRKRVRENRTIKTVQVSKVIKPVQEQSNFRRVQENREKDPFTDPQTMGESQLEDDAFLIVPVGRFEGLKISLTKLAIEIKPVVIRKFGLPLKIFNFSFIKDPTWSRLYKDTILGAFYISFSAETKERVVEYVCEARVHKPILRKRGYTWRLGISYIPKSQQRIVLRIEDCNEDPAFFPRYLHFITLSDIVFDKEQFESYVERIYEGGTRDKRN